MAGIGSLVAMPFAGRLAGRFGSGPLVLATAVLSGAALVSLALTPNVVSTGAALFVFGAAYGSWDVAMNIQGSYVDRTSGRDYMPRYHACWSVGAIIGAGLGALAAAAGVSLTLHFGVAAMLAVGLTTLVVLRWYVDDREPHEADAAGRRVRTHRLLGRRIVLIGVITLCATFLEGSAADWIALYLTDERGQAESLAALGYALWATAMAASRFSGTWVIERLGRPRTIRLAGVVVTLGVVATLALPGLAGVVVGVMLWGAGVALVFPAAMSAGGEQPGRAADGIATVSTIGYTGFLLGPPLIGLLAQEITLGRALWVLPVMGVAILALAPVVAPPTQPDGIRGADVRGTA
jgi:MFS family permease